MFGDARSKARTLGRPILIAVAVFGYALVCSLFVINALWIVERDVVIAGDPASGGSYPIGEDINDWLAENGVSSTLVYRGDAASVIAEVDTSDHGLLAERTVNVGFVAGDVDSRSYPNVLSLGSIASQPLLIFARAELGDDLTQADLAGKDISIGAPGSDVNQLGMDVLNVYGLTSKVRIHNDPSDVGIEQLLAGEIDALALLSPLREPAIGQLAVNPGLTIVNLDRATAAASELGYAYPETIPPYVISVSEGIPREPITTVAVAITVIANKHLDEPNVLLIAQRLVTLAAQRTPSSGLEALPSFAYTQIPASEVARSYYLNGLPLPYAFLPRALISWVWLPLGEIIALTIAVWAFVRFALPLIRRFIGSLNPAAHRLSHLEQRRRDGKPLTDRQIRNLERLIAQIEAERSNPTQRTLQRAQALLDGVGAHGDSVGSSSHTREDDKPVT